MSAYRIGDPPRRCACGMLLLRAGPGRCRQCEARRDAAQSLWLDGACAATLSLVAITAGLIALSEVRSEKPESHATDVGCTRTTGVDDGHKRGKFTIEHLTREECERALADVQEAP